MSDYSDIARSYLGGAQLGIQQFNAIQSALADEADRRQREEQFGQRQALDEQEFDLRRQQVLEQLGFQREDQDMQRQQFEWHQAQQAQEQAALEGLRGWAKERALAANGAVSAVPGQEDSTLVPQAGPTPATQNLLRLLDRADGQALRAVMPYLDDAEQHQKLDGILRGIDQSIGQSSLLADPDHQALYNAYRAGRDPDSMLKLATQQVAQKQAQVRAIHMGAQLGVPPDVASVLGEEGLRQLAVKRLAPSAGGQAGEASQRRWNAEQAANRYKALSGKDGKAGILVPPTPSEIKRAAEPQDPPGLFNKLSDDEYAALQAKIKAWDEYQTAIQQASGGDAAAGAPGAPTPSAPAAPQGARGTPSPQDMMRAKKLADDFEKKFGRRPTREEFRALIGGGQ